MDMTDAPYAPSGSINTDSPEWENEYFVKRLPLKEKQRVLNAIKRGKYSNKKAIPVLEKSINNDKNT